MSVPAPAWLMAAELAATEPVAGFVSDHSWDADEGRSVAEAGTCPAVDADLGRCNDYTGNDCREPGR